MPRKFITDISASTVQVVINYLLGVVVFMLTSAYLPIAVYGEFNWSVAVLTFATTVLSLRLEQIVVKKIAGGEDASYIMTLYLLHVLLTGAGFYLLLLLLTFLFPGFQSLHPLLLYVGISQLVSFFSSPFKQVANGKERFDQLALMSSIANLLRCAGLIGLLVFSSITIKGVLLVFIISSVAEYVLSWVLVNLKMKITISRTISFADYFRLLKESIPQIGTAILMAGITRIDWILLGIFSTTIMTAEYSFAYRVFELSPLPLLVIAPVLLSRFSRQYALDGFSTLQGRKKEISLLIRWEMMAATLIPLVLNIVWVPLFGWLTHDKYGASNRWIFLILSGCLPFQYINNLYWSAAFAAHRLKLIFRITLITFCIVVGGDLLVIPFYQAEGAAMVFLLAMMVECYNYSRSPAFSALKRSWQSLLLPTSIALFTGFATFYLLPSVWLRLAVALPIYFLLLLATRYLRKSDIIYVFQLVRSKK